MTRGRERRDLYNVLQDLRADYRAMGFNFSETMTRCVTEVPSTVWEHFLSLPPHEQQRFLSKDEEVRNEVHRHYSLIS